MYDAVPSQYGQTACDAVRCSTRRRQWKPAVTTTLECFVQVYAERLEDYARVTTKLKVIHHPNDVTYTQSINIDQSSIALI